MKKTTKTAEPVKTRKKRTAKAPLTAQQRVDAAKAKLAWCQAAFDKAEKAMEPAKAALRKRRNRVLDASILLEVAERHLAMEVPEAPVEVPF